MTLDTIIFLACILGILVASRPTPPGVAAALEERGSPDGDDAPDGGAVDLHEREVHG